MGIERYIPAWDVASGAISRELAAWRQGHPRATLAEIEAAVAEAVGRLQARYLQDLAHASAARDLTATRPEERPRCATCGTALQARGRQDREVLTARQPTPLRLSRDYGVCPTCGVGLFPPG